jgi:SAM-dependent methyltransferase
MLFEEAQWVGEKLHSAFHSDQVILNLGSSTLASRTVLQPHMYNYIFKPLKEKGIKVVHSDITEDEGVDLQGDFTDPGFIELLKNKHFDGVMCCNLLEHLKDRKPLIDALNEIVPAGGILLITVPKQYPHHLDPIDTMYRPIPNELTVFFPNFEVLQTEIVEARRHINKNGQLVYHKNYFQQLLSQPKLFLKIIARCSLPFYKPKMWWITVKDLAKMFRKFSVTCVVLKKKNLLDSRFN